MRETEREREQGKGNERNREGTVGIDREGEGTVGIDREGEGTWNREHGTGNRGMGEGNRLRGRENGRGEWNEFDKGSFEGINLIRSQGKEALKELI